MATLYCFLYLCDLRSIVHSSIIYYLTYTCHTLKKHHLDINEVSQKKVTCVLLKMTETKSLSSKMLGTVSGDVRP